MKHDRVERMMVVALLIALLPGGAWANRAGGIPEAERTIKECTANLDSCSEDLGLCAGGLGSCAGNLTACDAGLGTCTRDLESCAGDRSSCTAALNACAEGFGVCTGDLDACTAEVTECSNDLSACEAGQFGIPIAGGDLLAYEDCGDGTIADLRTGLMWEKKVEGGSSACLIPLHGVDTFCTWPQLGNWIIAVNSEGGTGYASHSDWRLPSVKELQSIVDYSSVDPAIRPVFGPTASFWYWSVTSLAAFSVPPRAWVVDFMGGSVFPDDMFFGRRIRAVRNGSCS